MIDREASGLIEALRLQKLRAIEYLLININSNPEKNVAVAIELYEDVYQKNEDGEIFEQDKNYDRTSKFTLNSEEILKSFCSFIDIWTYNEFSSDIKFCFLSTNSIGKEGTSARTKKTGVTLPDESLLDELSSSDHVRIEKVAQIVKDLVFDFYFENYQDEKSTIEFLKKLSLDDWGKFLKQITWLFGFPEIGEIEKSVIEKIKYCTYYSNVDNDNQEETIKAKLLELIEKKSIQTDRLFKLVQKADVQVSFQNAVYNTKNLQIDDVHILWHTIDKPTDFRNLNDKILQVCPMFSQERLKQLNRQAAIAKVFENNHKTSSQYLALKYRVFNFCETELFSKTSNKSKTVFCQEEIESIIKSITIDCIKEFEDLKKDFTYGVERNSIITELFIEFIDSCYLAFD
ncbi:hypothetical protein ACNQGC_05370 [Flavobacterium sp. GSP11]|uniref:hypothetical protein n=1 Tax=Flavobacterium sp. GSP11 TaxID=3401730 RepID=UPI003AAF07ED